MPEDSVIHTRSVSWRFSITEPLVLDQTARTRTVFVGELHEGGVRGRLCRQKIGSDGNWLDINEVNFSQVAPDAGVKIELNTEATGKLLRALGQLQALAEEGLPPTGSHDYVVAPAEDVLLLNSDERSEAIRNLLNISLSVEDWSRLIELAPTFATDMAEAHLLHQRKADVEEYESSLVENATDEQYWQGFFKSHPWMLEAAFSAAVAFLDEDVYIGGKRAAGRHGIGGVVADFLFADESTKSFAVVEIKTPSARLLGSRYRGSSGEANEVFTPHNELSGAVVQLRNQISAAVADFDRVIRESYPQGVDRIHPKGVLVIGQKSGLSDRELASFNHFRHGLYSLTVITFDELHRRLQIIYDLH